MEGATDEAVGDFAAGLTEESHSDRPYAATPNVATAPARAQYMDTPEEPSRSVTPADAAPKRAAEEWRSPEPETHDLPERSTAASATEPEPAPDAAPPPAAHAPAPADRREVPQPPPAGEPAMGDGLGAERAASRLPPDEQMPSDAAVPASEPLRSEVDAGPAPEANLVAPTAEAMDSRRGWTHGADAESAAGPTDAAGASPVEPATDARAEAADLGRAVAAPPAYRPRLQRARRSPPVAPAQRTPGSGSERTQMEADLQISFRPGDFGIRLSALLRRPADAEEVTVSVGGEWSELGALDDRLLEPLPLDDIEAVLRDGLLVEAADLPVTWRRSSRPLHVFGARPSVAGFGTIPRIVIGQENVVVCADALAPAAARQIAATGASETARIEGPGVPPGWVCWRGVRPLRPATPAGGDAMLHALDPLPAIAIDLSGGLQLSRGIWLEGRPPSIRLLGAVDGEDILRIDGGEARLGQDDGWTSSGWDLPGRHRVEYGGVTASYEIAQPATGAPWWAAHATALAGISGALAGPDGPLHFCRDRSALLIGAAPGQVCAFTGHGGGIAVARPGFDPVWRVSRDGRRTCAVLVGTPRPPAPGRSTASATESMRWARAVKAAGRSAGLDQHEADLWRRYLDCARSLARRSR